MRMVVSYIFRRRGERLVDTRTSTWESDDGLSFRHSSREIVNGRMVRDFLISAERSAPGKPVKALMKRPSRRSFELPADTVFPIVFLSRTIAAARSGAGHLQSVVYEGGRDGQPLLASAAIGRPFGPDRAQEGKGADKLRGLHSWPVSLAYYKRPGKKMKKSDFGLPEVEVSYRLYENGVSGDVTFAFGDFALAGKLRQLRYHAPASCR